MKTIVIGVGNPILQDDGIGIHVINRLQQQLNDPSVTIDTAYTGGINLLDLMIGYDKAILVDAISQPHGNIGKVKRLLLTDAPTIHSANPHDVSLSEAIHLANQLGERNIPSEIIVIGIIVKNTCDFGEHLSPEVAKAVPTAIQLVLKELKNT